MTIMATTKDTKSTDSTTKSTGTAKKSSTTKAAGTTKKPAGTSKTSGTSKAADAGKTTETSKAAGTANGAGAAKKPGNKKKSKAGGVISTIISILVLIIAALWFVSGRVNLSLDFEDGLVLTETEKPILFSIPSSDKLKVIPYEEETAEQAAYEKALMEQAAAEKKEREAAAKAQKEAEKSTTTTTTTTTKSSGKKTGTAGSNPSIDQGKPEDDPLYFGNPSDATADVSNKNNYLMVKDQYTLSYNSEKLIPNWAAWHLDTSNLGDADRCDDFRPDPDLPAGWYAVTKADYQYSKYGFDRGHVCPSADRTTTKNDNSMTFLMTNMVPQSPDNNRVIWMHFEKYERDYLAAKKGYEVYIVAGPYGSGGTTGKGTFNEIPINLKSGETLHMNVPATTWKVLIALPSGENDMARIEQEAFSIAINVPNEMGMQKTGDWEQFICTIDDIEALTGYDFFELLPDALEDKLESAKFEYVKE